MIDRFRLGLRQPHAGPASAGEEPRRRRRAADAVARAGHPAQPEAGHEHFNGSLVIPVFNLAGEVVEMYGRKITPNLRDGNAGPPVSAAASIGACGTKKRSSHRRTSSCAKR